MNNPCHYCQKRNALCRIGCKDYKIFEEANAERRRQEASEKKAEHDIKSYKADKKAAILHYQHLRRRR